MTTNMSQKPWMLLSVLLLSTTISAIVSAETLPTEEEKNVFFSDITVGSPYLVQLKYLHAQGLVEGYENGTFQPNKPVTRAEAAVMLERALMEEKKESKMTEAFSDVPKDHWAHKTISRMAEKKIIKGYKNEEFKPNQTINQAEAIKMVIATEQLNNPELSLPTSSKSSFKDMKGTEWFAPYIEAANQRTMLTYSTKMLIYPADQVTRGEFADLVYRAIRTREPGHFFGRGTYYSDSFEGRGTSAGEKYRKDGYTAAHKTLPFNTKIKVTYLRNEQSVVVRVNDRGPFTPSMDVDLTRRAFTELANPSEGIIPIEYEIVNE